MSEREKVIKAIDICLGHGKCNDCSYHSGANYSDQNCRGRMLQDVLAMLKTETGHWIYKKYDDMFMCSCCEKYSIRNDYPYCHWCGAKMEGGEVNGQGNSNHSFADHPHMGRVCP